jgi:hypothetical protein
LAGDSRAQRSSSSKRDPEKLTVRLLEMLDYSARLALEAGELDAALRAAREAVRIGDLVLGIDAASAYAGHARLTLGDVLAARSDGQAARAEFERSAALLEDAAGPSHPWTIAARSRLAARGQ